MDLFFCLFVFLIFNFFWLCWVFVAACGLSLVAASGGYSSLRCVGSSLLWLLLLQSTGPRVCGLQQLQHAGLVVVVCGFQGTRASVVVAWDPQLWLAGSREQAQQLWHTGLVAPRHVGSSRTRDRTCDPSIGRRILNHCTTREVPDLFIKTFAGLRRERKTKFLLFISRFK